MYSIGFEPRTWCASWMIAARYAVDVQDSQDEMIPICVWIYSLLSILDLFSNRTSDTCQIQSSRLDRILWSHRWWKVVPSQKFVNIIIRNSNRLQVYQVSQILLVSSSGSMGVSCLRSSLFDSESWWRRCAVTHIQMYYPCFPKNSENLRTSKKSSGLQTFQQIEFKILSIRIIRIIRKKSQNRLHRFFGQRINKYHIAGNTVVNSCLKIRNHDDRDFSPKMTFIRKRILEGCVINPLGRTEPPTFLRVGGMCSKSLGTNWTPNFFETKKGVIRTAWRMSIAFKCVHMHGFKPLTRSKISEISHWQKCFSELKISNPRISCTLNEVSRSSWKVLWVTTSSYASETSFRW